MKKFAKRILAVACAFALVLSCGAVFARAAEGDLDIGKMEIVLPENATDVEKTAAEELMLYVNKMTGQTMKIVTEGKQTGKAVYVGATQFAADNAVAFEDNMFGEGWAIKAVDGNLVLTGGAVRGTMYAVYHLLEDVFGVRWWNPWEEYVPTLSAALVPADYNDSDVPDFLYRDVYSNESWQSLFFVRNRVNGYASNGPTEYGGEENHGMPYLVHTIGMYFPPFYKEGSGARQEWVDAVGNPEHVNFFEVHPEWFALDKTSNSRSSNGHMCLTNEGFREEFVQKMLATIQYCYDKADAEGVARPRYFSITPNDQGGRCECEACETSVAESGESGNLLKLVNYVADKVAEVYPEVFIETLAYWNYLESPLDDTKPRDNVVIRYADNGMDVLHDLNHKNNERNVSNLKDWIAITKPGNLYIWDYAIMYSVNGVFPSMYKYGDNFALFKELGVNGYFVEIQNASSIDFWDMKVWLISKLAEDVDQDYDALMDEFIYGYYGEAAGPYIRQYLDYMHEKAEACNTTFTFGLPLIKNTWLKAEEILQGNAYFEQAFAAAEGDEVALKRLCVARGGLDRQIAENYILLQMQAEYVGLEWNIDRQELLERTVATLREQIEVRGGSYLFDINSALAKYELDLKLLTMDNEVVPEETETEPPATEQTPVTEPTEPVEKAEPENNGIIIAVIVVGVVVAAAVVFVCVKKRSKK